MDWKNMSRPDKTFYFQTDKSNLDSKKNRGKQKVSTIQKKYFANPEKNSSHDSVDSDELEKYIDKVEKRYHSDRRKEWAKAYKEQFKTKYPKDGKYQADI